MENSNYKKAFSLALLLHIFLGGILFIEPSVRNPVLVKDTVNMPGVIQPVELTAQEEPIKAVSVDSKALSEAVNQLKMQKAKERQAEINRQNALNKQAEIAKQNLIKEQQKLAQLKKEAEALAIAKKKQVEEEKKRLKALAEQKAKEAKRLEDLKKARQQEADKLADLKKKQMENEQAIQDQILADQEQVEKDRQRMAQERAQAEANAANRARMSGEVDKYRALILNAISRQWIIPDSADRNLISQFRIRLAPDGSVLEVNLIRSSGDPILDRSAQTAIYKASPLPVPQDPVMFNLFRDINLKVKPEHRG